MRLAIRNCLIIIKLSSTDLDPSVSILVLFFDFMQNNVDKNFKLRWKKNGKIIFLHQDGVKFCSKNEGIFHKMTSTSQKSQCCPT